MCQKLFTIRPAATSKTTVERHFDRDERTSHANAPNTRRRGPRTVLQRFVDIRSSTSRRPAPTRRRTSSPRTRRARTRGRARRWSSRTVAAPPAAGPAASWRLAPRAASSPAAHPIAPSSRLSTKNCRRTRARPAPIAVRIAISRWRADPRTSRRFAVLTHTISKTRATAACRMTSGFRASPTSLSA